MGLLWYWMYWLLPSLCSTALPLRIEITFPFTHPESEVSVESILPIGRWLSIIFLLLMGPHYINKYECQACCSESLYSLPVKPKIRAGLGLLFNYGDEDLAIT